MLVNYLTPGFEFFAAYCRSHAGYYPGVQRKARREAEIKAHAAGVVQSGPLSEHAKLVQEFGFAPCGAPGLLGGANSPEEYSARRAEAYPDPGKLP